MLYDDGRNVRLLYELEVPMYPQEAQEVLAIYKTGDYSVQVRVRQCLCIQSLITTLAALMLCDLPSAPIMFNVCNV